MSPVINPVSIEIGKKVAILAASRLAEAVVDRGANELEKRLSQNPDHSLAKKFADVQHCPRENGSWQGERGNSKWVPDGKYVPQKMNPKGQNWESILKANNIDGVVFKDGEPNFKDVSKIDVKIKDFSSDRADNFDKADIACAKKQGCSPEDVAKWRKSNGYTWHECGDMNTMQLVPRTVHGNIPHRGGVSNAKAAGR